MRKSLAFIPEKPTGRWIFSRTVMTIGFSGEI